MMPTSLFQLTDSNYCKDLWIPFGHPPSSVFWVINHQSQGSSKLARESWVTVHWDTEQEPKEVSSAKCKKQWSWKAALSHEAIWPWTLSEQESFHQQPHCFLGRRPLKSLDLLIVYKYKAHVLNDNTNRSRYVHVHITKRGAAGSRGQSSGQGWYLQMREPASWMWIQPCSRGCCRLLHRFEVK